MRRVMLALVGTALLLAAMIFLVGDNTGEVAAASKALAAFVCVLVLGVPALKFCCRRRWWEVWRFLVLGALAGLLGALPFLDGLHHFALIASVFVATGVVISGLFWFAAIWRNHDLTCPKTICLPCGTVYRVARNALRRQSK